MCRAGAIALLLQWGIVAGSQILDHELESQGRLFPEIGPGFRAIKRDAAGRYYILTAPSAVVQVYDAGGKRTGQIPANPSTNSAILFGEDLDVDTDGRVYVVDAGANAVKVFDAKGSLMIAIPVARPLSVAALEMGELAVTSLKSARLVDVYNLQGKIVRQFGDFVSLADRPDLNRFLNLGRLASDPSGHLYYAFTYLPEPTVRKYDRLGYAVFEAALTTLEFQPEAQAMRREIQRQEEHSAPLSFKPVLRTVGVDPKTLEVWVAMGDRLVEFDRDGNHLITFRTYAQGSRIESLAILLEPGRLLLGDDPQGIYEFARPHAVSQGALF